MKNLNPVSHSGGGNDGPPGQDMLGVLLAACFAFFVTPVIFEFIGPYVERLVYETYGSQSFAEFMYYVGFALLGGVLFAAARMFFWYVLAALVAFLAQRAVIGGGLPSMAF